MPKQFLTTEQAMRYNRQIVLPNFDLDKQEILLNAKVLIVGVGGLGCTAAQYLVAAGVGEITLIDDDKVEKTNLQRQILHGEADVGINKCLSAKASLEQLNSDIKIQVIQKRLALDDYLKLLESFDLVLDCTDNLASRNILNQACYQVKIPLVSGVMSPVVGIIGAMQALEAIKIVCDYGQSSVNKLMMFDGMTATWQTFTVPKKINCSVCG